MTDNRNYNPFANNFQSYVDSAIKKAISQFQTCIPAIIKEVKNRNTVIATPAVQQTNAEWASVPWASIKLPVITSCGGKGLISFPVAVGDTGWIIAGDLDPSLFLKDPSTPARQNIFNRHQYQFGFFLPDNMGKLEVSANDDGGIVIQNNKSKIVIKEDEITIESNDALKINAKSVSITSSGNNIEIDGTNFKNHTHDTKIASGTTLVDPNTGATTAQITLTSDGVN